MTYFYDFEVLKYDWIVVFKGLYCDTPICIHNDTEELKSFLDNYVDCLIGCNVKHYDKYILLSILNNFDNNDVFKVNKYIIDGGNGWELNYGKVTCNIPQVDLFDDMQQGLSLKAIEAHMGWNIKESDVDFNLDRPLTTEELDQLIYYCKQDVLATEKYYQLRLDYLNNKIEVGKLAKLSPDESLTLTNAKLTAKVLGAVKKEYNDEREYEYPPHLKLDRIPKDVIEFFNNTIFNKSISNEEAFSQSFSFSIGQCDVTVAFGGIHGAIPTYQEEANDTRVIINVDVQSFYPNEMIIYDYQSRSIADREMFPKIVKERVAIKKSDPKKAGALKLVINGTYGATLDKYNPLYDPLKARSVCISGQLFLLDLTYGIMKECISAKPIQLNTDGLMLSISIKELEKAEAIIKEWEQRTGFVLETDNIAKIIQKDVNNYIEVQLDGTIKHKGSYLVRGISKAGAFNINNNACIVAKAIEDYLVYGTPVETTIGNCNDSFQFQLIAKASGKYSDVAIKIDGEYVKAQRVNRVFASPDVKYGTLYKRKVGTSKYDKIGNLPDHCFISNTTAQIDIKLIDKSYYIDLAHKRINDFKGDDNKPLTFDEITKENNMATTNNLNVYQKLAKARLELLNEGVTKSGKNMGVGYAYFELADFIPSVTNIFEKLGLLSVFSLMKTTEVAYLRIINVDNPNEEVVFESPYVIADTNRGINPLQALGATHTYMRRYMYFMALDLIEYDTVDADTKPTLSPKANEILQSTTTTKKAPVTQEQREVVKDTLTKAQYCSEEELSALQEICLKALAEGKLTQEKLEKIQATTKDFSEYQHDAYVTLFEGLKKKIGIKE